MCRAPPSHSLDNAPELCQQRVQSASMGARSVSAVEPRKRLSLPNFTAATLPSIATSAPAPPPPRTLSSLKFAVPPLSPTHEERPVTRSVRASPLPDILCTDTFVITLPTYPFPPPRMPLVTPLVAKNPPRKSLLKRWRAKSAPAPASPARRALAHLQRLERDLQRAEVDEIVAYARVTRPPRDDDIPRIRRLVESAHPASREDIVRVATRLVAADTRPGKTDSVTLALHELESQARAEVQVVLDRDCGAIRIEASERLRFVREQIVAARASSANIAKP